MPLHNAIYDARFGAMRAHATQIAVLGGGAGGSAKWAEYFPNAIVHGLATVTDTGPRIRLHAADFTDPANLRAFALDHTPGTFDLIIVRATP